MKKLIIIGIVLMTVMSCEELTDLNRDVKNPERVPAEPLLANAQKVLFDFMTSTNVNVNNFRLWSQQWAQTTYADESNYELVERNVNGAAWNILYADVLRDLSDAKASAEVDVALTETERANQVAISEVLSVFTYHVLVDLFGDIPYSAALTDDPTPAYDAAAEIYADLITRLNAAIPNLGGDTGLGTSDLVYGGQGDKWRLFANSLKLRLAIRLADVNPGQAKTLAEDAYTDGVIMSSEDNFALKYQTSPPNTNPLWLDLIQSGRSDYIAANTLVDQMVALNDPRLPFYYKDPIGGEYKGGVYGDQQAYNAFSHPGEKQLDPTWPGTIMSSWEVSFLLADAAQRGFNVGQTAEYYYEQGIRQSILYWGGTEAQVIAYLAKPAVAFATAPGTPLQRIALQKWISLYDQGFEAWSTYRLYDYPPMAIAALSGLETPRRYTYPVSEYSLNEENVRASGSRIGGDALSTRLFWDVN
jgi:hypothetical protein